MQTFNIGIKGVVTKGSKVLMLKSIKGFWEVPGGRMDEGEGIADTLRRELAEELPNIKNIEIHEALSAFKIKTEYIPGMALMLIFYRVTADFDGEPQVSDEHSEYSWVTKQEALELTEEATQEAIENVFKANGE